MTFCFVLDDIRKLFTKIIYSEKGTNDREQEEATFMFFMDYMEDCERGNLSVIH